MDRHTTVNARPSAILIFNKCKQLAKGLPPYLDPDQFRRAFNRATVLLEHGEYRVFVRYSGTPTRLGHHYEITEVELDRSDAMPFMKQRIDLGTFDTREQGAEVVLNDPAELVERLNNRIARGKANDRELARASRRTVAKFNADAIARDPRAEEEAR